MTTSVATPFMVTLFIDVTKEARVYTRHLVNAHEVKPVRLIQPLCAVFGSNLAVLNPFAYSAALRGGCCTVLIARFDVNSNKRKLFLR